MNTLSQERIAEARATILHYLSDENQPKQDIRQEETILAALDLAEKFIVAERVQVGTFNDSGKLIHNKCIRVSDLMVSCTPNQEELQMSGIGEMINLLKEIRGRLPSPNDKTPIMKEGKIWYAVLDKDDYPWLLTSDSKDAYDKVAYTENTPDNRQWAPYRVIRLREVE